MKYFPLAETEDMEDEVDQEELHEPYTPYYSENRHDNTLGFVMIALVFSIVGALFFSSYYANSQKPKSLQTKQIQRNEKQVNVYECPAFFGGFTGNVDVCIKYGSDGKEYRILTGGAWKIPALSPNGRRIAAARYMGENQRVYVVDISGANLHQVTFGDILEYDYNPFWIDNDTIGFLRKKINEPENVRYFQIDLTYNNVGVNLQPYNP